MSFTNDFLDRLKREVGRLTIEIATLTEQRKLAESLIARYQAPHARITLTPTVTRARKPKRAKAASKPAGKTIKPKRKAGEAAAIVMNLAREKPEGVPVASFYEALGSMDGAMIARLTGQGRLKRVGRGLYALGPKADSKEWMTA